MTPIIVLAFCASGPIRADLSDMASQWIADGRISALAFAHEARAVPAILSGHAVVLLGVGAEGCAALAQRVEAEGLEGVAAVVLIAPSAPWAERRWSYGADGTAAPRAHTLAERLPLGPLEPLRAVAERARDLPPNADPTWVRVGLGIPKIIIACHPEPAKCRECGGRGWHYVEATKERPDIYRRPPCESCSGTGKALGLQDIAAELGGVAIPSVRAEHTGPVITGVSVGLTVVSYPTRAAHDDHAIAEALRLVLDRV